MWCIAICSFPSASYSFAYVQALCILCTLISRRQGALFSVYQITSGLFTWHKPQPVYEVVWLDCLEYSQTSSSHYNVKALKAFTSGYRCESYTSSQCSAAHSATFSSFHQCKHKSLVYSARCRQGSTNLCVRHRVSLKRILTFVLQVRWSIHMECPFQWPHIRPCVGCGQLHRPRTTSPFNRPNDVRWLHGHPTIYIGALRAWWAISRWPFLASARWGVGAHCQARQRIAW